MNTSPEELLRRFGMTAHVENGSYAERHYPSDEPGRPASGSIYYYVSPEEITKFHTIDCDEYWVYVTGSPLEICSVSPAGEISCLMLGIEEGCVPFVCLKAGVRFASRHPVPEQVGTFLVCITVPRFDPAGFVVYEEAQMLAEYPELASFFRRSKP